jgi:proline dehydrogenase
LRQRRPNTGPEAIFFNTAERLSRSVPLVTFNTSPTLPAVVAAAAEQLRKLALNEDVKARFCSDPLLRPLMHRVSVRYVAGRSVDDVLRRVQQINERGHAASAEFMGESCRDESKANTETEVFLRLIQGLNQRNLNCSISFDLSHVGSLVDPQLGYHNANRIAGAAAAVGREAMISMEAADRIDDIYATYVRLHIEARRTNIGITVPVRLRRTDEDLPRLMAFPGRIRLVKGAYPDPEDVAYSRGSPELPVRFRRFATQLLIAGCKCSIATHDRSIQNELASLIMERDLDSRGYEFESLLGLGTEQIDELHRRGFPTREYAVFGEEHFLYVLNRIAEEPLRVYQALVDLLET